MNMNERVESGAARTPRPLALRLTAAVLCLSIAAGPSVQAQTKPTRFRGEPVTLNFVNADIEGVTRAVGAILGQQFIVDPRVKGNITLYSEQAMTPREVYLNYLAALRGLGFTVVEVGDLFKVVPEADAKLQTSVVATEPAARQGDRVITQIFRLTHENANNLVPVLRPLISPNNTINANPGNNTLVITDYADNLQRISKIVAAMDTPSSGDVEVIPLKNAVAADLLPLIQRMADSAGQPGAVPGAAAPVILVDARSNSLIVRAANPARLALVRSMVEKLDQPSATNNGMGNIWVVYLKNADAVKLAAVLRAAFSATGSGGGGASSSPSTPQAPSVPAGAPGGASTQSTAPVTPSAGPSTGGFIQADPSTNSLIITASLPLYQQLRNVIDKLDTRRAQIYIETLIVKIDAQKAADIGIQWQAISNPTGNNTVVAGGTNYGQPNIVNLTALIAQGTATAAATAAAAIAPGLNFGVLNRVGNFWNIGALANFLETKTDANVMATPNLIALDNEEAKIVVGQNVPFVTGSYTNTGASSGSVNPFQTVERKDVGLTLRIKSQIGENGTIRLTIYHENSTVVQGSAATQQGLTTDKSAIETTVVVDDGQIMVLGGLLQDQYNGSISQVPFLGSLPVIGPLFRVDNRTRTKTNLLVFLRPMVIRTQDDSNALSIDRYEQIRAQQQGVGQPPERVLMPNGAPIVPPFPVQEPGSPLRRGQVPAPLSLPDGVPMPPSPAASAASAPATPKTD
jgi:general secretion pathway protein D